MFFHLLSDALETKVSEAFQGLSHYEILGLVLPPILMENFGVKGNFEQCRLVVIKQDILINEGNF